ncbi:MAG: PPC domain-containing DNA-binding protein [Patescibacteria group bacterium]
MKITLKDGRRYILRFDKGEEVSENLKKFIASENIGASYFSAIGACGLAELSYFNLETKKYQNKVFEEDLEIVSLTGNSSLLNNNVALHAHAVLSRADFSTLGGHLFKLVVSATCEVFLIKLDGKMERKLDEGMNLNLLFSSPPSRGGVRGG